MKHLKRLAMLLTALALTLTAAPAPASATAPYHSLRVQTTTNVYLRVYATTNSGAVELMQGGLIITVYCWVVGQNINGDPYWYYASPAANVTGFVAGYYVTTGHDPNPALTHC